ncbi:MAG: hypothetical protein LBL74_04035 [Bacteroidales bacterium]|nr:hypothetical protein [Bacteroidales bacterium]
MKQPFVRMKLAFIFLKQPLIKIKSQCDTHKQPFILVEQSQAELISV